MIPYEDLVAALAQWRVNQGLPAGAADYLGDSPITHYDFSASLTQTSTQTSMSGGETVDVGDDMVEDDYSSDGDFDVAADDYTDDYMEQPAAGQPLDDGYSEDRAQTDLLGEELAPESLETVESDVAIGQPPSVDLDLGGDEDPGELPAASFEPEATSLDYDAASLAPGSDDTQDQPLEAIAAMAEAAQDSASSDDSDISMDDIPMDDIPMDDIPMDDDETLEASADVIGEQASAEEEPDEATVVGGDIMADMGAAAPPADGDPPVDGDLSHDDETADFTKQ